MYEPKRHWVHDRRRYEDVYRHERERAIYGFSTFDWWNFDHFLSEVIVGALTRFKEEGNGYPSRSDTPDQWYAVIDEMIEGFSLHLEDKLDGMVEDDSEAYGWRLDKELHEKNLAKFKRAQELFSEHYTSLWD